MYNPLPRDWLMATARIYTTYRNGDNFKSGSGSGFWTRFDSYGLRFVTNRHNLDYRYVTGHSGYELSSVRIVAFDETGNPHPDLYLDSQSNVRLCFPDDQRLDLAVLFVLGDSCAQWINSFRSPLITLPVEVFADDQVCCDPEQLAWGAYISFTSYQAWMDSESGRPILRTGIVASDPLHDYKIPGDIDRKDVLLLEAFSFAGSSGSLVMANSFGQPFWNDFRGEGVRRSVPARVVGIMSGHLRNNNEGELFRVHPGLSYCHRSTCLRRILLDQEEVKEMDWSDQGR